MTAAIPSPGVLPAHIVRRPRLHEVMQRPGARLVVVTGPAGSGKSVAVRDWTSTASTPTAWLGLDSRHSDPENFLDRLLTVLEDLAPGVLEAAWRDDPGDHAADRAIDRAVEHLAGARPAILVLDDLHMIDRSPTAGLLARLVEVIPFTNLTLVICSRSDPPLPLHRFRLTGELVEVREADLRFDAAEASQFFTGFPDVRLDADHVERLAERTEGWAAGLHFAALSLAGREDADAFVDRFAGSARHVADFLLDEVLDRQPEDMRQFLLSTSVLERFGAGLCEAVSGQADAAALLRRVETENLFLVALDDQREWFRYHHLFGQLLQRELRLTNPEVERVAHERAARWLADNGQPAGAIDHLLEAGHLDQAFDLLTRHLMDHLVAGRHETVRGWLNRFPDSFVEADVGHHLLLAWAHARAGHIDRAKHLLERNGHAPRIRPHDAQATQVLFDVVASALAAGRGDPEAALDRGDAAWQRRHEIAAESLPAELAGSAPELWGYLPAALARACALLDDREGVRRWTSVVRRAGPRLPSDLVAVLGAEAWAEARNARLRAGEELADQALAMATEYGRGARRAMIGARVTLALVYRERDDLDAAFDVLAPHVEAATREGHVAVATLGEVELARVEWARGRHDDAITRLLRVRRDRAAHGTPPFLGLILDQAECRLRLHAGDLDRATDLLGDIPPGPERVLLEARVSLVHGRPDTVVTQLADLRGATEDRRRRLEAAALSARAAADVGDLPGARRMLADVADIAGREGVLRTFLDEGFDIRELLGGDAAPRAPVRPSVVPGLVEPLSERELVVLRYLPSRLSNRAIGAELYVSLNTVKSHLKAIYRKLGVDGRDEAVRRARQLGLL